MVTCFVSSLLKKNWLLTAWSAATALHQARYQPGSIESKAISFIELNNNTAIYNFNLIWFDVERKGPMSLNLNVLILGQPGPSSTLMVLLQLSAHLNNHFFVIWLIEDSWTNNEHIALPLLQFHGCNINFHRHQSQGGYHGRIRQIGLRTAQLIGVWGMKDWPPKPGFTSVESCRLCLGYNRQESGVAGFNTHRFYSRVLWWL